MKRFLLVLFLLILVGGSVAKLFIIELPRLSGNDMAPALQAGDMVLAYKLDTEPARGQLVLMEHPSSERLLIRRVIGLPGERVQVIKETPAINGKPARRKVLKGVSLTDSVDGKAKQLSMKLVEEVIGDTMIQVLKDPTRRSADSQEITLTGSYFVMSDNRNHGTDSRTFGPVPVAKIRAVVTHLVSVGPPSVSGLSPRSGWSRIQAE